MSIDSLMNQAVTVLIPDGDDRDEIGASEPTFSEVSTTMYLEPGHGGLSPFTTGREDRVDRNTPIGDWFGAGRTEVGFTAHCRIVYGTHTFDVIAPPRPVRDPMTQAESHIELSLQEVT